MLDNDEKATVLQATLELPNGLSYVAGSVQKTSRIKGRGAEVQASTTTGKLVIVETDGTIAAGEGAVITFQVKAFDNLSEGDHEIKLTGIVVSDPNGDQLNTEEENTAIVTMLGLCYCEFTAPESFDIAANQEYQVDVTLKNDGVTTLAAFQGKLALPEGLVIVPVDEENFIYSDRIPSKSEFKFQEFNGFTSFVLSSSANYIISGVDGVIFSFKVKADPALPETSQIRLYDLRVATNTGQSQQCPNVTISVTNTSELLWKELQGKLAELKAKVEEAVDAVKDNEAEIVKEAAAAANDAYDALEEDLTNRHTAGTLEEIDFDTEAQPTLDAIAAIDTAVKIAIFNDYKAEQIAAIEALAEEGDSEASQKIIADAKAAIEALEYDKAKELDENKAAVDEIVAPVADALVAQRAADLLAANKAAFEDYKTEKVVAIEALAEELDSEASQKIIADAKAAIEALEYDEAKSLDENKAAVDEIVAPVADALDAQRAADLAANKAAFETYKVEQVAAVEALAKEGDSEASQKIIADAKTAIEALEYDEAKSLDENKAAVDAVVTPVADALDAQRAADQLAADKAAFEAYKAEQVAAVEALAKDGDSEASKKVIADAKAAIEALEYDESKSLDENKAAVDAIVAPVADALDAQRDADQLAADKAAFEAYKAEQVAAVEALAKDDDSEASQKIIADAKAAIEALEYDEAKSLDENKAAVDAIVTPVDAALETQRAADLAADKAAFEAYKATATAAADQLAADGDSEASQALIVAAKAAIEALEYNENESLEENIEAVDAILADLEESLDEQRGEDNDTAYAALSAELDELDEAIADAKDVLSDSKYALVRDEFLAQLDALQEKVDAAREDLESRNGQLTLSSTNIESITLADVAAVLAAADAAQVSVPGDLNNDGEISMYDFDLFVDELLDNDELWDASEDPVLYEEYKKYDVNGDGRIDVADAQALINLALGLNIDGTMPNYVREAFSVNEGAAQLLTAQTVQMSNGVTRYILNLNRSGEFASFQMKISGNVVNMSSSNASLRTKSTADGCRVLGFANGNVFNESELLVIDVIGEAQFSNITLATTDAVSVTSVQAVATAITTLSASSDSEARYDLSGKQLNAPVKGVNIVRDANGKVRKVMVK